MQQLPLINCDLGELSSLKSCEEQNNSIMPHIDLANIACGGHSGNAKTIALSIKQCLQFNVKIGVHPSYLDPQNFGRKSQKISTETLQKQLYQQLELMDEQSQKLNAKIHHLKLHGALYHDSEKKQEIWQITTQLAEQFKLKIITSIKNSQTSNTEILKESFADRSYDNDKNIIPRTEKNSVIENPQKIINQYKLLCQNKVITNNNNTIECQSDTICFHSDNPASIKALKQINNGF